MSPTLNFTNNPSPEGREQNRKQLDTITRVLQKAGFGVTVSVTHSIEGSIAKVRATLVPTFTKGSDASQPPNYDLGTISIPVNKMTDTSVLKHFTDAIRQYVIERR